MGIIAAGSLVADIVSTTVFQRIVEDDLRGRVLGGMQTLQTGTYAAGALLLPVLFSVARPAGRAAHRRRRSSSSPG